MSDLERRYQRLVRAFYPPGYRDERGTEIVGTYLALSAPGRQWPSIADAADLAGGGLRQRLRAVGAGGIGPGLQLAAILALTAATTLAGGFLLLELNPWAAAWFGPSPVATPSVSHGVWVWAAWLLAAGVHVAAPGRWTRRVIGLTLVLTVALPLADVLYPYRPPLFVLVAQACLGLVALGVPAGLSLRVRLLPLAGAVAALPVAVALARGGNTMTPDAYHGYYGWPAGQVLPAAGVLLLLAALVVTMVLAARDDLRGVWALLVLLGPIGMMWLHPLAEELAVVMYGGGPNVDIRTLVTAASIVTATAVTVTMLALTIQRRVRPT
ncbi:hypothetical protein [Actinoplanes couchii]|uniref:Integral membrane protein n=1 Tax=Actinoplanes couchii TaxID=403638 RepID=A0ABQ3XM41_9ACTN|nr:hypothetical protein [Actinoplanes couchii]MDR6319232.1 hypothetical protein [Actinoplanes couchii]GID59558.1 hypothetical protein Aco03nite_079620 [Actinoplanes couchii]